MDPIEIPETVEAIEILALAGNGVFFPLREVNLDKLLYGNFQRPIMLRYKGQMSQLKEYPSE